LIHFIKRKIRMTSSTDEIIFDVRGVRFEISRSTLTKRALLSRNFLDNAVMQDGAIVLDRDPEVFKEVINYLKGTGFYRPKHLSEDMLEKLYCEAKHFNLRLLKELMEGVKKPDYEIVINARGTLIKTTRRTLAYDEELTTLFTCPQSPRYIKPEADGSFKIDADAGILDYLITRSQKESWQEIKKVYADFSEKYGVTTMMLWLLDFDARFCS